jgi:hypothetical protein
MQFLYIKHYLLVLIKMFCNLGQCLFSDDLHGSCDLSLLQMRFNPSGFFHYTLLFRYNHSHSNFMSMVTRNIQFQIAYYVNWSCVCTHTHTHTHRGPFLHRHTRMPFWKFFLTKMQSGTAFKIHLKDIDDGALHFCILFIRTLSIVQFIKSQRLRDWLCLRLQVIKRKGQKGGDPSWWVP